MNSNQSTAFYSESQYSLHRLREEMREAREYALEWTQDDTEVKSRLTQIDEAEHELDRLESMVIGLRLVKEARAFSGSYISPLEEYEGLSDSKKVEVEVRRIANLWPIATTPDQLQRLFAISKFETLTGRLAAIRLVRHYDKMLSLELEQTQQDLLQKPSND